MVNGRWRYYYDYDSRLADESKIMKESNKYRDNTIDPREYKKIDSTKYKMSKDEDNLQYKDYIREATKRARNELDGFTNEDDINKYIRKLELNELKKLNEDRKKKNRK